MHTHLDHLSLCLISSLLSLSSSVSQCSCLYAVLLSTRRSNHDPLLTLTRSRMTTLQEEQEEEEEEDHKCRVRIKVRFASPPPSPSMSLVASIYGRYLWTMHRFSLELTAACPIFIERISLPITLPLT